MDDLDEFLTQLCHGIRHYFIKNNWNTLTLACVILTMVCLVMAYAHNAHVCNPCMLRNVVLPGNEHVDDNNPQSRSPSSAAKPQKSTTHCLQAMANH